MNFRQNRKPYKAQFQKFLYLCLFLSRSPFFLIFHSAFLFISLPVLASLRFFIFLLLSGIFYSSSFLYVSLFDLLSIFAYFLLLSLSPFQFSLSLKIVYICYTRITQTSFIKFSVFLVFCLSGSRLQSFHSYFLSPLFRSFLNLSLVFTISMR